MKYRAGFFLVSDMILPPNLQTYMVYLQFPTAIILMQLNPSRAKFQPIFFLFFFLFFIHIYLLFIYLIFYYHCYPLLLPLVGQRFSYLTKLEMSGSLLIYIYTVQTINKYFFTTGTFGSYSNSCIVWIL